MSKYLIQASYTAEGIKGLLKEGGTKRRKAVEEFLRGVDGRVESFYFALGEEDVYLVVDLPDTISAANAALHVSASGVVRTKTIALLTAEDIDTIAKHPLNYRAPGK